MRQKWLQKPPLGTPINWSHPSAKGLVLNLEFQEGGGDVANDLSGNANHGVLKNMAFPPTATSGWNPGKFGGCPSFDGTDDYVDCGNDASLDITNAITIEAWVKLDIQDYSHLISKWSAYVLRISSSYRAYMAIWDGGSEKYTGPNVGTILQTDKWYHLVGTYDGNTVKQYVNGTDQGSDNVYSGDIDINANILNIGRFEGGASCFNGSIDEVRIYNRALSAEEIFDSYINPFAMFERTKWGLLVPFAPPSGLSIPVAMHNYRRLRA